MGRRKIEIKAIKDDRNRSVTFLKRKGGLFKKAHELSVLCSVDVAVIIFGHNKKLYEFSSGDINETIGRYQYYGQPHEHKGPADFAGKRGGDMDDDDDEDISPPPEDMPQPGHPMIPPHLQNQPSFQHMRGHAPSASPPISNGVPFHHRQGTPQPQIGSRPSSRNNIRRMSSNLVPQHHTQATPPPPTQNGFAYMPNPPLYNPQANPNHPHQGQPQHPQYQQPHYPPPAPHQQVQQAYIQDQRRQSMPPAFPQQERPQSQAAEQSPPQQHQPPPQRQQEHPTPPQIKSMSSKSRSIFTPIDDSRSLLAQHFGFGSSDPPRSDGTLKPEPRSDASSIPKSNGPTSGPIRPPAHPQRTHSVSSVPTMPMPVRTNSEAKRPRLKVQIPSEQSDGGSATAESSPRDSQGNTTATPAKGSSDTNHSSGVVLPPPSPSASALLSAGASGPPNPFARPPPPGAQNQNSSAYNNNNNIETPISALPSRFMADGLLPSPSSFYPDWGFGRSGADSNMLPSPLNFPTPVMQSGLPFPREVEEADKKRKNSDGPVQDGMNGKRVKT